MEDDSLKHWKFINNVLVSCRFSHFITLCSALLNSTCTWGCFCLACSISAVNSSIFFFYSEVTITAILNSSSAFSTILSLSIVEQSPTANTPSAPWTQQELVRDLRERKKSWEWVSDRQCLQNMYSNTWQWHGVCIQWNTTSSWLYSMNQYSNRYNTEWLIQKHSKSGFHTEPCLVPPPSYSFPPKFSLSCMKIIEWERVKLILDYVD